MIKFIYLLFLLITFIHLYYAAHTALSLGIMKMTVEQMKTATVPAKADRAGNCSWVGAGMFCGGACEEGHDLARTSGGELCTLNENCSNWIYSKNVTFKNCLPICKKEKDYGDKCMFGSKKLCCKRLTKDNTWAGNWTQTANFDLMTCSFEAKGTCGQLTCSNSTLDDFVINITGATCNFVQLNQDFEVKTIDGAGYLSNVLRLKVVFENGDHFPLILKAPTDEKIEKILADDEGKDLEEESPTQFIIEYHNQEINFYNKIGNQYTGLQLPKLYGYKQSTLNPPKHGQILLEDVTHLGMLADTKMGLNLEQCESVIKAIASFHVYTLSLPNIEEILKSMPNVMLPFREEQFGIHEALCRLDPFFNAHRQELKFYFDKGAPQEENPHLKFDINAVLSHGDLWANNMFFERKSDGSCGNKLTTILDWQACYPDDPELDHEMDDDVSQIESVTITIPTDSSVHSSNNDTTHDLEYRATDCPKWNTAILLGFQQTMVCFSGILVIPNLVAEVACAGAATIALRVQLISTTLVVTGITTLIQTTLGLRLAILQGPSFAFIPPLYAFNELPGMKCTAGKNDEVPEEYYLDRMRTIQGSLAMAAILLSLAGATGLIGIISRRIGPLVITPLMILLCLGNAPLVIEKSALHWISVVQFVVLLGFALFLSDVAVPLPYFNRQGFQVARYRLFGQFPYLISIILTWLLALFLTETNLEPEGGYARVDNNQSIAVLTESPWIQVPYPGQFGWPKFSVGLFLGMIASCIACSVESIGAYGTLARVSQEKPPNLSTLNRSIFVEGIGCFLWFMDGRQIKKVYEGRVLRKKIREHLSNGLSREETFNTMCGSNLEESFIRELFEHLEGPNGMDLMLCKHNWQNMVKRISTEYYSFQSGVAVWPERVENNDLQFRFIDSRYALRAGNDFRKRPIYLIDILHGEKRRLKIEGKFPQEADDVTPELVVIDSQFALLIEQYYTRINHIYIHLLRLDLNDEKCTLLSSKRLPNHFHGIIFDKYSRHKFAIKYADYRIETYWIQMGRIEDSKLSFDDWGVEFVNTMLCFERLSDNKLQTVRMGYNVTDEVSNPALPDSFGEYDLVKDRHFPEFRRIMDINTDGALYDYNNLLFHWVGELCYVLSNTIVQHSVLYVFELAKGKLTRASSHIQCDGYLRDIHFGEDGIFSVFMLNFACGESTVFQYALSQPFSLDCLYIEQTSPRCYVPWRNYIQEIVAEIATASPGFCNLSQTWSRRAINFETMINLFVLNLFNRLIPVISLSFRHRLLCARLIGNTLQTMVPNWQQTPGVGVGKCVFGEFTLVSGEHDPPLRILFDLPTEIRAFMKVSYWWIGNDCFLAKNEYRNEQNAVLKFSSNDGKLEATKYKFFCDNKLEDLLIDEEEQVLTVCVEHRVSDQLTIHRFALNQPDTLSNLALFALRREAIFFDSPMYDKLFSRLSSNLEQLNVSTQSTSDLLHELHSLYISEENATRCFKSVAEASPPIQEYFDDTYWNLLMLIVDEIERIDCCISIWNDNNTHKFLDSRYSLMFDNYDRGIYLLDNFYRRAKYVEMKTLEGKPFLISCCRIDVIAPDMFVLFDEDYNTDTFVINLCRMDYSNEEPICIQLDSKKLAGECPKAVFDYNDRRRFVIRNEYKNETCVQLVRVEDSKLVFGGDPIQIVKGPMCARLNGNKLELLTMEYNVDNVRERVVFGEFDLTGNPKTSEFKKLFNVETRGRIQSLYHESFVWSAERCYIGNFNPFKSQTTLEASAKYAVPFGSEPMDDYTMLYVNASVGTPSQQVKLVIRTESYGDASPTFAGGQCQSGSFDPSKSSTYVNAPGKGVSGTDTFTLTSGYTQKSLPVQAESWGCWGDASVLSLSYDQNVPSIIPDYAKKQQNQVAVLAFAQVGDNNSQQTTGTLVIGDTASDLCQSDWQYLPFKETSDGSLGWELKIDRIKAGSFEKTLSTSMLFLLFNYDFFLDMSVYSQVERILGIDDDVEAEEENCPSVNATFFYSNDANLIQAQRYLSGVHKSNEDFSIRINSTGVQALAFDYQHNESLFVAVDKPDTIWGVSRSLGKHVVVQLANASFDWITSDPATSNIYFADNQRGIGVCIGHSKNTSCAMLIKNPTRKSVTYKNLILYHQRGVMFFIQKEEGQESVVKMASMNGQHVRVLTELGAPKSITLNTQLDRLYVGHDDHTLKKFTVHNQKTEKMFFRRFKEIFVLNCDIHALEKDYIFDVRTYASKEQLKLKMAYDTLKQSFNIDFPSVPVLVVLDSDLALKSNPCKNFQCDIGKMNALTCGLLAFGFILQFCFCKVLAEQKTESQEERENACPNSGATFYYILNERIYSKHYDFIKNQGQDVFINTELSSIRAIAYDYKHNESLTVDNEKPDTVWGFSRNMLSHSVVQLENASFDFIAADPTTGNIYFADNNQGIGVCSGHSVNTSCTLLIPKPLNKIMDYKDLVLYYQRGILFWIEGGVGISIVKMASMSGKHIRELDTRHAVKGIALDSRKDSLYILRGGYIKKYVIHKHASVSEYYFGNAINQIFTMSCGDVFLFKNQTETLGYFKLFTEKLELVKLDKSVQGSKVSRVVSVMIHDNDKSPKPNPCKNFQCNGICVITEAFPDPMEESRADNMLYLDCKLHIIEKNYNNQEFYTGQEKLIIEKSSNVYPTIRIYTRLEQIASVFVMDSDRAQKSNPCKDSKCYGTCVLSESFLREPIAECVGFKNVYKEFSNKRASKQYIALIIGGLILLISLILLGSILFIKRNRILQIVDTQSTESVEHSSTKSSAKSVVVTEL
ncbi:Solute carrier family 23 member 2 [Aphelenchoides bicaudatus]|nr:Solute carrier family 23 member 2 [Aphelenchoides bicaudatus]